MQRYVASVQDMSTNLSNFSTDNLAIVPMFEEANYYSTRGSSSSSGSAPPNYGVTGDGNTAHLRRALTRTEILHFSRRVGYSPKSLNFEEYVMPDMRRNGSYPAITLSQAVQS